MAKVVTLNSYLRAKREYALKLEEIKEGKRVKREKVKKTVSFFAGILLYWIACVIITMGFFAVVLYTL